MKPSLIVAVAVQVALAVGACTTPAPPTTTPTSLASNGASSAQPVNVDPAAGLPYTCGVDPFDIRLFSTPSGDEREASPAAAALREIVRVDPSMPSTGWWLVSRTATRAQYLARAPDGFFYVIVDSAGDGGWRGNTWGSCVPTYAAPPRTTLTWAVAPGNAPKIGDRTINVVVVESCQPDPLDRRLAPPIIRTTPDAILIVFTAAPGREAALVVFTPTPALDTADHCPGSTPFMTKVVLDEPLGDRLLLDGGHWPPRDATTPFEP